MRCIVVFVALMTIVNGRPQYNYPKPGGPGRPGSRPTSGVASVSGNKGVSGQSDYKYDRPGTNEGQVIARKEQQGQYRGETSVVGGDAIIHKHVYVHVPPPELEEQQVEQRPVSAGPPEKHYKIIFIKAPAPATPASAVIPLQATKEEKTLVYVLVKKPEEAQEVTLATPEPTQPSKPEVYFIRYKAVNKEGAQQGSYQEGGVQQGGYQEGAVEAEGVREQISEGQTSVQGGAAEIGFTAQPPNYLPPRRTESSSSGRY